MRDGREERGDAPGWEVVWRAPNHAMGGMVRNLLTGEGLLVMMRSLLGIPHLGFSGPVEILVPSEKAGEARSLLNAIIGAGGAGHAADDEDTGPERVPRR